MAARAGRRRWFDGSYQMGSGIRSFSSGQVCFRCDWHVKAVAKVLGESQSSDIVRRQRQEPGRSAPKTPATEDSNCSAVLTRSRSVFVPAFRISHSGPFLRCAVPPIMPPVMTWRDCPVPFDVYWSCQILQDIPLQCYSRLLSHTAPWLHVRCGIFMRFLFCLLSFLVSILFRGLCQLPSIEAVGVQNYPHHKTIPPDITSSLGTIGLDSK